ncbi:hypothetical protein LTR24_002659 [Lithohypha guttulata]|uniref:Uncharacterized protein n=1 Tax=Lithohypha guttulata TaxID=1690604 RepID=A0ABR0KH49_9EURO|nr:hypothetical protein LTR24_002659 [Lithohypha guttulata]
MVEGGDKFMAAYIGSRLVFFNTWGPNVEYTGFTEMIWDIAGSRTSTVALATVNGLFIADPEEDDPMKPTGRPSEEQMAVAFQDPNIVMSGQRSGRINFTDIRAPGSVHRIQHSSAVSGITTARTTNHIIVSGLSTTNMYDLRYTKSIDHSRSKKHRKQAKSQSGVPLSIPFVRFHVPDDRLSKSYGLGKPLGYMPSHDIAVVASHQASLARRPAQNKVTLYHASTGKILQSPLTDFQTSTDIHNIVVGRVRDGPESIFVATAKALFEWSADLPYDETIKGGMRPQSPHPDWLDELTYELGPEKEFFPPDSDGYEIVKEWTKGDTGPDA